MTDRHDAPRGADAPLWPLGGTGAPGGPGAPGAPGAAGPYTQLPAEPSGLPDPFPPGLGFTADRPRPIDSGPLRPRRRKRRVGRWIALALVAAMAVALVVIAPWDADRRQVYADQWVVWTEPPSTEIERLAQDLTLTEEGRRIFFASRPQIESAQSFQDHCPAESQVVLGCYFRERIFVYEVTDERLAGTIETTMAHELLHALHDRLNPEERRRIDALVEAYVAQIPGSDPNISIVAGYAEKQQLDEWHSRLGTSYPDLPAELETHFARVFSDRSRIIAYSNGSTAELDGYSARIRELSALLDAAYADLEARSASYDAALTQLNREIEDFNRRARAGDFSGRDEFDREYASLTARQDALEQTRLALNADVDAYNAMLEELRTLDAERAQLYAALDSRAAG